MILICYLLFIVEQFLLEV